MDGVGALYSVGEQQLDPVALDPLTLGQAPGQLTDPEGVMIRCVTALAVAISSCGPLRFDCSFSSVARRSAMTRSAGRRGS